MTRRGLAVLALTLGSVTPVIAQPCATPAPGPGWVCVQGGWLPPGHPGIPSQAPGPPPPVAPTPDATCTDSDGWVYEGERFKIQFDHDGAQVGAFLLDVDGLTVADVPVTALLPRTATVDFPQGLPLGLHLVKVYTTDGAGVITAESAVFRLEVRARRADRAATHVRVLRGDQ